MKPPKREIPCGACGRPSGELLTKGQFCELLGISVSGADLWHYSGVGPPRVEVIAGVRYVRYRRCCVDAWLDAHTVQPGHKPGPERRAV